VTVRRLLLAIAPVAVAAAIVAVVLAVTQGGSDGPKAPSFNHISIAPGASAPHADGKVFGTTESPQQVASEAVENQVMPNGMVAPDQHPLPPSAFDAPVAAYHRYADGQARAMGAAAASLQRAVDRGDRAGARSAFDQAFDRWMLVGAAYGALGDLDGSISGSLDALETGLWSSRAVKSLHAPAAELAADGRKLPAAVKRSELDPLTYATRAHEILEDVQRDRLSDRTGVRATADAVSATKTVLNTLRRILQGRGDVLAQVDGNLRTLSGTLTDIKGRYGAWPAPAHLSSADHERFVGQLGATLEALSGVPGDLETIYPQPYPKLPGGSKK
jgi:iron uptake system EfeUOB component EfeO/EfeM